MNRKQASIDWEVSPRQVDKICKYMEIPSNNIPDDTIPVYLPDMRYKSDPHRFYIFVLDVIINTHLELVTVDKNTRETCVEQLKRAGLIVLKHGKNKSSVDYHDYMISPDRDLFYGWKNAKMKAKLEMIRPVMSAVAEGVTAAGTMSVGR